MSIDRLKSYYIKDELRTLEMNSEQTFVDYEGD